MDLESDKQWYIPIKSTISLYLKLWCPLGAKNHTKLEKNQQNNQETQYPQKLDLGQKVNSSFKEDIETLIRGDPQSNTLIAKTSKSPADLFILFPFHNAFGMDTEWTNLHELLETLFIKYLIQIFKG